MKKQVLEVQKEHEKTPKGSLFNSWVSSSQIFSLLTPQILDDYSEREVLFSHYPLAELLIKKGMKAKTVVSLLKCGSPSPTDKLLKCSCGCGSVIGEIRHHCSNRSCPKCSKRRQRKIYRKYYPLIRNLVSTPLYSLKFLSISPKNYETLKEGQEHIRKSINKMLRLEYFKQRIEGGFYVIESKNMNKNGKTKGWNIHAHMIIYSRFLNNYLYGYCSECKRRTRLKYDNYNKTFYCSIKTCSSTNVQYDQQDTKLVREMKKAFKRPLTTDIKHLKDRFTPFGTFRNSEHALNYCLKYVSVNKNDFATQEDFAEYIAYTTNRKLIHVFGVFYNDRTPSLKHTCLICKEIITFELVNKEDYYPSPH